MNPEIKAKWLEALRSGKYQQGSKALRWKDDRYCCLGVLCDVVDPKRWMTGSRELVGFRATWQDTMPGILFLEEVGLPLKDAEALAEMNDDGKSFAEIADKIEKDL